MQAGDQIVSHASGEGQGGFLLIKSVVLEDEHQNTYNFEVADTHTYFVGKLNALVHNTCSPDDLISNGGRRIDNDTIISVEGDRFTRNADGTYTNAGPATGRVDIETGAHPDANERRAGEGFANQGYNVQHRQTASEQGITNQRTSDLHVDGIGDVDVYTPQSTRPTSIARGIESKNDQAPGVLVQSDLTNDQMTEVANRVWGKPGARNINLIFFQNSAGDIVTFTRPSLGK